MKRLLHAFTLATLFFSTASVAQNPPEIAPAVPLSDAECAKNPFRPECGEITIRPGAVGTGLKPGTSGPGLIPKGLRPMDKPSFDRDALRMPKL